MTVLPTHREMILTNVAPVLPACWALHYGNVRTPMVEVIRDEQIHGMFRLQWPGGQVSDMANISRTRDAAMYLCSAGPPIRDRRRFNWKSGASI